VRALVCTDCVAGEGHPGWIQVGVVSLATEVVSVNDDADKTGEEYDEERSRPVCGVLTKAQSRFERDALMGEDCGHSTLPGR
jgi:hypothetical protein